MLLFLFSLSYSSPPLWELEKTSINLLSNSNSYEGIIFERSMYNMSLKLVKKISKEGSNIIQKNILYIDNELVSEVDWEEIDSFYNINGIKYICPRGHKFMYKYNNSNLVKYEPSNFDVKKEWELRCFYLEKENFLFNFFLSKGESDCKFYALKLDSYLWYDPRNFNDHKMYDFSWTTNLTDEDKYPMTGIIFEYSSLVIQSFLFTVKGSISVGGPDSKRDIFGNIDYGYKIGYFDIYNNNFYFMGYSFINLLFKSGYYNGTDKIESYNIYSPFILNDKNPLEEIFDKSVIIKNMSFIKHTKYIYYKIEKENIFYHGIIDIILNKVIFNTNEEIIEFKPYGNNSMLAITKDSAYKICAIKGNKDNCIDECPEGKIIYDLSKPNQCEIKREDQEEQKNEKEQDKKGEKEKNENKDNNENKGDTNIFIIIVIIIFIIIIIISILGFLFYRKYKKRAKENELLSEVYTELEVNSVKSRN